MFGPKCTGFCWAMSLWGAIFMAVLGGLFQNQSVGLFEDLPKESTTQEHKTWDERRSHFVDLYKQNAKSAWVAAVVYVGFFVVCSVRLYCLARR